MTALQCSCSSFHVVIFPLRCICKKIVCLCLCLCSSSALSVVIHGPLPNGWSPIRTSPHYLPEKTRCTSGNWGQKFSFVNLCFCCVYLYSVQWSTLYFSNMESLPELGLIISICQAARLESYLYLSFVFACDYIRPMVTQCVLPKDKQNQSSLSERSDSHFHLQPRHAQHLKIWAHIFFSTLRGAVLAVALALILFSCNFPTKSVTARPSLCKPTAPKQLVGVVAGNCARL